MNTLVIRLALLALLALLLVMTTQSYAANPLVKFTTSEGEMIFELYPEKAPRTVANFLHYVNNGFYQGTIFHRAVEQFVVQGGGLTPDFEYKTTLDPIPNESNNGLRNEPGTLAMARLYEPDTATSQFYINLSDNKYLNFHSPEPKYQGYCVFGKVVLGLDVAKKISRLPTGPGGPFEADVPAKPVLIQQAELIAALPIIAAPAPPSTHSSNPKKRKG
ncbi:MAG: peptidylprolyl isomerase [Sulfuricella sp.]|nr:peptidylprolyl isomerase [Sulfuricella sp.]